MSQTYQHWRLETDLDRILWLTLDRANSPVNSLSKAVFDEFEKILTDIKADLPLGVVIVSGKKKGFIAGADVTQFTELKTQEQAFEVIRQAQLVLDQLEALPIPTLALINGFCLGGGTELALACRYRIACDVPETKIGLPEVKLGIHPGWGGTVRLPLLVGAPSAMQVMLTGNPLSARAAKRMGVVDEALPLRELKRAAVSYMKNPPAKHQPNFLARLSNSALVRPWLGKMFYHQLTKNKVLEAHYPAPFAIIRNWIQDGAQGADAMINEAKSISRLMVGETARNLLRVFFLQNTLKELGKGSQRAIDRVHVVGAGTMGGDIAAFCAYKGLHVTLQDQSAEKIAPAILRASRLFQKKLKQPRLVEAALDRLLPDQQGSGVAQADLIIEAIFENVEVKQKLFQSMESKIKTGAILATNTSSIPLEEIASALNHQDLVGIHFFNPVSKMPLVEVVHAENTPASVVQAAAAFVTKIGRFPVVVKSKPGFLVNRVLMPYLMEAMHLLQEGVPMKVIDQAALKFGMPMGPITLADTVGLEVCLSVAEKLTLAYGGQVPSALRDMVSQGQLGVKSGQGFYRYVNGKKVESTATSGNSNNTLINEAEIIDRLILCMVNEAVACLHEKIADSADLIDAGMIFGTGFAPFRGGPLHYARTRGVTEIVARLLQFTEQFGERFTPKEGFDQLK